MTSKLIYIRVDPCLEEDLFTKEESCADKTEKIDYYKNLNIELLELKNFIDYQKVKTEPLQKFRQSKLSAAFYLENPSIKFMKFTETQVTLQDNLWQYFVEPEEFSFLTFSD